jgi:hypothetical protein
VICRTRTGRPEELPIACLNHNIINTGFSAPHETVVIEFPLLVAMSAKPVSGIVMPFILESDRDSVFVECPQFFYQAVVEFFSPFALLELDDRGTPVKEFGAVAPLAIYRISKCDPLGVSRIPGILS